MTVLIIALCAVAALTIEVKVIRPFAAALHIQL